MRILHIVRQFYPMIGGIEAYVLNLAAGQHSDGHKVAVLTLNRSFINNAELQSFEVHPSGIEIIRIPYFLSKKYPVALTALKYVKDYDIVNVHAVDFFADFIALTKFIHRKKIVLITHGGFFHTNRAYIFKKIYFNTVTRFIIKFYDEIIGCSENDLQIFQKISSRVIKIENGVNISPYLNKPKRARKNELLYVGRIDHHKRIDKLIIIVAKLKEKGHDVNISIVGPDWKKIQGELERMAKNLNVEKNIRFIGAVSDDDLKEFYSEAFLFISASEYEGFGISAIEAMASGTICVLSKINSFEVFLRDTDFGILCNFNNIEETAEKISQLLNVDSSRYNELSIKARKYSGKYSWDKVINQFYNIYERLGK